MANTSFVVFETTSILFPPAFRARILSVRLATEAMSDDKNKVTNGDSFGATFKGAEDDGSTSFEGDVELGKIGFCGWSDNKKTWLILKLLFLGFTVQVRGVKGFRTER